MNHHTQHLYSLSELEKSCVKNAIMIFAKHGFIPLEACPIYISYEIPETLSRFNVLLPLENEREREYPPKDKPIEKLLKTDLMGQYFPGERKIVLYPRVMEKVAMRLSIDLLVLRLIVIIHELGHWITHFLPERKSHHAPNAQQQIYPNEFKFKKWSDNLFNWAPTALKEGWAQLICLFTFSDLKSFNFYTIHPITPDQHEKIVHLQRLVLSEFLKLASFQPSVYNYIFEKRRVSKYLQSYRNIYLRNFPKKPYNFFLNQYLNSHQVSNLLYSLQVLRELSIPLTKELWYLILENKFPPCSFKSQGRGRSRHGRQIKRGYRQKIRKHYGSFGQSKSCNLAQSRQHTQKFFGLDISKKFLRGGYSFRFENKLKKLKIFRNQHYVEGLFTEFLLLGLIECTLGIWLPPQNSSLKELQSEKEKIKDFILNTMDKEKPLNEIPLISFKRNLDQNFKRKSLLKISKIPMFCKSNKNGFFAENGHIKELFFYGLDGFDWGALDERISKYLTHVEFIDLSKCGLTEIPQFIFHLPNLKEIDLSFNQIRKIPPAIKNLKGLRKINLEYNSITEIDPEFGNLKELIILKINENHSLKKIPECILELESLQVLEMGFCNIQEVPRDLHRLKNLLSLALDHNSISSLPSGFNRMCELQFLDISHNLINRFPRIVWKMAQYESKDVFFDKDQAKTKIRTSL